MTKSDGYLILIKHKGDNLITSALSGLALFQPFFEKTVAPMAVLPGSFGVFLTGMSSGY